MDQKLGYITKDNIKYNYLYCGVYGLLIDKNNYFIKSCILINVD
jgi:hypothetical protein